MSEELKAKVRLGTEEGWNKGNVGVMDDLLAENIVRRYPNIPDVVGREAYKQLLVDARNGYSDFHLAIEEQIAEGNTVVTRFTMRGTHTGKLPSIPILPTGKSVTFPMVVVHHFVDGRIVEELGFVDYLGLMQQLGAIPAPGQAQAGR